MSLLEKIQQQRQEARISKDRAIEMSILTLLVGELDTASKRGEVVDDKRVEEVIRKLIKSNDQTIAKLQESKDEAVKLKAEKLVQENAVLQVFLPQVMDEATVRAHIVASGATDMKGIMGYMKQFGDTYDSKMASTLAKEYLAK